MMTMKARMQDDNDENYHSSSFFIKENSIFCSCCIYTFPCFVLAKSSNNAGAVTQGCTQTKRKREFSSTKMDLDTYVLHGFEVVVAVVRLDK